MTLQRHISNTLRLAVMLGFQGRHDLARAARQRAWELRVRLGMTR